MGACRNSIFCVFVLFLARFLFKSSFFSKSRLCTRPLFSHFVTNLDRLAGQPILWIPPWGQSCGRQLYGSTREQRNHGLKYEWDCARIGIGIKIFMNHGSFCERSFRWVFVIHTTIEWKHSFCFRTSFHSRCVS